MKVSDQYLKIVEWSEEDQCYVGTCPLKNADQTVTQHFRSRDHVLGKGAMYRLANMKPSRAWDNQG